MKKHFIMLLAAFFCNTICWLQAVEFDKRVDISFFIRKDGSCVQASLAGSNLLDQDLDLLYSYDVADSVSICFGGSKSQLTSKKLEMVLTRLQAKEVGFFDCENNLNLLSATLLSPFLKKLKIRVDKIDGTLMKLLADLKERKSEIDLVFFSKAVLDTSFLAEIGKNLKGFKSVRLNDNVITTSTE
jgi:hypothetical protein